MHSGTAGASPAGASIFAASLDKKLRLLEETTSGSGLAVTAEVDVDTVITQLVAPGPGGAGCCCKSSHGFLVPALPPCTDMHCTLRKLRRLVNLQLCLRPPAGGRLLFAATEDGSVRAYKLPLTPDFQAVRNLGELAGLELSCLACVLSGWRPVGVWLPIHQPTCIARATLLAAQVRCGGAPVTRLTLTRDESTLFAATANGCLHVFDVRDRDAARFLT